MRLLRCVVKLALLALSGDTAQGGGCDSCGDGLNADQLPDDTITGVASPSNFIIKEVSTDQLRSSSNVPIHIRSDVPLTIQRFDDVGIFDDFGKNPVDHGEGMVLVTSNCDTSNGPAVLPEVTIRKGEGGSTYVDIEVGVAAEVAEEFPFYESSSYDVEFYESGCGWYTGTPDTTPVSRAVANVVESTMCRSEAKCDEMRQKMGMASFQSGNYPSKGCFSKNGIAYWGEGGSDEEMSKSDLPGVQQRIWCERVVGGDGKPSVGGSSEKSACMTQDKCAAMTSRMGISEPLVGSYPTKGCFSKNGIAYWGDGGSPEETSKSDLPGVQERIWCEEESSGTPVNTPAGKGCETGPDADPSKSCVGDNLFCQLGGGVCNTKIGVHSGVCEVLPEACIEIYLPVCGCDGNTYSNECKAHSKGISISRKGKCGNAPAPSPSVGTEDADNVACLSQQECDDKRQELGMLTFYSGDYPTKGCFSKNGKAYWSDGGRASDKSKEDLPGLQERIWCAKRGRSGISSVLQQESVSQVQHDASSAFSLRSCMIGSLLSSVDPSRAAALPRTRALDTSCGFNAEVLLAGCDGGGRSKIQVAAPKARVINSAMEASYLCRKQQTASFARANSLPNQAQTAYPK